MRLEASLFGLALASLIPSSVMARGSEARLYEIYSVDEGGKCGYISASGRYIIPAKYDRAEAFVRDLASVTLGYDTYFIDPTGKVVFKLPDRERSFGFDERDDTAIVETRDGKGVIDRSGNVVVPAKFFKVVPFGGELSQEHPYPDHGTTVVQLIDQSNAVIDRHGNILFGPRNNWIVIQPDGVYAVGGGPNDPTEYYDRNFKLLPTYKPTKPYDPPSIDESKFGMVGYWHDSGYADAQLASSDGNGLEGIINRQGQWVVRPLYQELFFNDDSDELTYIHARRGSKWGFVDISGKEVIPFAFDRILPFVGNHAPAAINGKWGLIDRTGHWKLQPNYDEVEELSDSTAAVRQGRLWGVVDYSGHWLIEPRFETIGYCQGRPFTMAEQMFEPEDSPTAKEFEGLLGGLIQEMDKKSQPPTKDK